MEFISDDYPHHSYLHHRNVLNPYDSPYAHPDYLGGDADFGHDDEPFCPDDEESGQKRAIMDDDDDDDDDYITSSVYQTRHKDNDEEEDISSRNSRKSDQQWEEYSRGTKQNPQVKSSDDYNPKTDGKGTKNCTTLEEKLTYQLEQLKAVLSKRFNKFSEFCSWNCFFSLLFVVGVLLVFLDHYGSSYVRMMNMQKFFFFVMGVLTTTVAVVVVCVVVAFTSCYGDGF